MSDTSRLILGAAATCVVAPLMGAVVLRFTERRLDPRAVSIAAMTLALAAAGTVAGLWHAGPGRPACIGPHLAGGDLVLVDGLTALLLPYVAVVVANVSADRKAPTAMAPERALGPQRMPAPAEPVVPATGVIRIQESPRRDDDRSR